MAPAKLTVSIQKALDGSYGLTLPNGKVVPVNRKQRRTLDAEARRKKRRGHARH